ncbi:MAG TPA: hypothetical protein VNO79_03935 [Actinomycetota bacterium]|nr:hypothetical protein [Actinomycetota bacterium]
MELALRTLGIALVVVALVRFGLAITGPITRLVPVPTRSPLGEARPRARSVRR